MDYKRHLTILKTLNEAICFALFFPPKIIVLFIFCSRLILQYLFSSGICRAIMVRGSVHSTIQPCLSLTRPTCGFRKWLGILLQITGVSIWTSSRGGHWGTGFLRSLWNMAAERGMIFYRMEKKVRKVTKRQQIFSKRTSKKKADDIKGRSKG